MGLSTELNDSATKYRVRIIPGRRTVEIIHIMAADTVPMDVCALRKKTEYGLHGMEHEVPAHHTGPIPKTIGMGLSGGKQTQTRTLNGIAIENENPAGLDDLFPAGSDVLHVFYGRA